MLAVEVKRSKWFRGHGGDRSKLLIPETGEMCCLGFACLVAGLTKADISDRQTPSQCHFSPDNCVPVGLSTLVDYESDTGICSDLMRENDVTLNPEDEAGREAHLTFLGKLAGIDFTFVD